MKTRKRTTKAAPKRATQAERDWAKAELANLETYLDAKWTEIFIVALGGTANNVWDSDNRGDLMANRAESVADIAVERLRGRRLYELRRSGVKV